MYRTVSDAAINKYFIIKQFLALVGNQILLFLSLIKYDATKVPKLNILLPEWAQDEGDIEKGYYIYPF